MHVTHSFLSTNPATQESWHGFRDVRLDTPVNHSTVGQIHAAESMPPSTHHPGQRKHLRPGLAAPKPRQATIETETCFRLA
jgi:hypothetical protein